LRELELHRKLTVAELTEVFGVDGLAVVGNRDIGIHEYWSIELLHCFLVLFEQQILLLLLLLQLRSVLEGLQLLFRKRTALRAILLLFHIMPKPHFLECFII